MLSLLRNSTSRLVLSCHSTPLLLSRGYGSISYAHKASLSALLSPSASRTARPGRTTFGIARALLASPHQVAALRDLSHTAGRYADKPLANESQASAAPDVREARNAYARAAERRRALQKEKGSASNPRLAEAIAETKARWAAYQGALRHPDNAAELEAYRASARSRSRKHQVQGSATLKALQRPTRDSRVFPLSRGARPIVEWTIAETLRARNRAYERLHSAKVAQSAQGTSCEPELLEALRKDLEASRRRHKRSWRDPRNAEEAEELRKQKGRQRKFRKVEDLPASETEL